MMTMVIHGSHLFYDNGNDDDDDEDADADDDDDNSFCIRSFG